MTGIYKRTLVLTGSVIRPLRESRSLTPLVCLCIVGITLMYPPLILCFWSDNAIITLQQHLK